MKNYFSRQPILKKEKYAPVRLRTATGDRIVDLANTEERTMTMMIDILLREALDRRAEVNA